MPWIIEHRHFLNPNTPCRAIPAPCKSFEKPTDACKYYIENGMAYASTTYLTLMVLTPLGVMSKRTIKFKNLMEMYIHKFEEDL